MLSTKSIIHTLFIVTLIQKTSSESTFERLQRISQESTPEWVAGSGKLSERRNVIAVSEGANSFIFHCRIFSQGEVLPGALYPDSGICRTTQNSKVIESTVYEYLRAKSPRLVWVPTSGGTIPTGAVIGGVTKGDDKIYIARLDDGGEIYLGKALRNDGAYFAMNGVEKKKITYDVLCVSSIVP